MTTGRDEFNYGSLQGDNVVFPSPFFIYFFSFLQRTHFLHWEFSEHDCPFSARPHTHIQSIQYNHCPFLPATKWLHWRKWCLARWYHGGISLPPRFFFFVSLLIWNMHFFFFLKIVQPKWNIWLWTKFSHNYKKDYKMGSHNYRMLISSLWDKPHDYKMPG